MTPTDLPVLEAVLRLATAFVLALPLGWDREERSRSAGLRTYPLLAACACGFLLIAQQLTADATAQADVLYGLLSGIGFVGSGAMMRSPDRTRGMSTAMSLWVTGAIGAGVAYGNAQISAALTLLTLVALRAPKALARRGSA
jgi:putative Mg2+ transporter-C (MgtC) family protein